jgi:hypothetical protein
VRAWVAMIGRVFLLLVNELRGQVFFLPLNWIDSDQITATRQEINSRILFSDTSFEWPTFRTFLFLLNAFQNVS